MVIDFFYIEFVRDVIVCGIVEVGMYLYVWNSLLIELLIVDDWCYKFYFIEYSDVMMCEKVDYMMCLLEDIFQIKMVSYCVGCWVFDECYVCLLVEYGYQVDCLVILWVNWKIVKGVLQGDGGIDYCCFLQYVYFFDENDISCEGYLLLLEVLMSIQYKYLVWMNSVKQGYDCLCGKV